MSDDAFVQLTLHTSQVRLLQASTAMVAEHRKTPDHIKPQLDQLAAFLNAVVSDPRAWAPTGRMATSLKIRARRLKGPLTASTGKTKRAARTARRKAAAKARRANRA